MCQAGVIYSKAFPQLILTVTSRKVTCNLKHPLLGDTGVRASGFQVGLTKRSNEVTWTFTGDGLIFCDVSTRRFKTSRHVLNSSVVLSWFLTSMRWKTFEL